MRTILSIILIALACSCHDGNSNETFKLYTGKAFLQPLDTVTSLHMAEIESYIFIEFLDDDYCNVLITNAIGTLKKERLYTIRDDQFILIDPISNEKKAFTTDVQDSHNANLISESGIRWNLTYHYADLNSSSSLKKNAMLYPVLNERERQYGAGERFYFDESKGELKIESHPLKNKVGSSNYLDEF